jgi:outer membrane receptor for ferrienterochelin and colicin
MSEWDGHRERAANTPDEHIRNGLTLGRVNGSIPFGGAKWDTSFYGSRELYKLHDVPSMAPLSNYDNRIGGADTHLTFTNGAVIGGSYERDARRAWARDFDGDTLYTAPHHIVNTGLYAQAPLRANNTTIIPAIRYDHHSAFGSETNPRISIVDRLNAQWRVTGNIARSHRNPTLVDLYEDFIDPAFPSFAFFSNPKLKPEISWNYDVGTDYALTKDVKVAVTGFMNEITDRIVSVDTDGQNGVDTIDNIARAEIKGIEAEVKAVTGPLSHSVNYTFQEGRGTTPTSPDLTNLPMTPHHTINYVADLGLFRNLHFINSVKYVSSQYQLNDNLGTRLPPYAYWNTQLRNSWGPVTVFARVDNVTNRRYAESITFGGPVPQPTRAFWAGTSIQF